MASLAAKAALLDTSMKQLQANIDQLSKLIDVEPLKLTEFDRDPVLLMAYRMRDMASWTETLVKHFEQSPIIEAADGDRDTEDAQGTDIGNLKAPKTTKGKR